MKRFLTIFYYRDIGPQHLYKDVGSIPYALGKYYGWNSAFAYVNINGNIHNESYEKVVKLIPIKHSGYPFLDVLYFLWKYSKQYDVLNFYHMNKRNFLLIFIAKLKKPYVRVYVKLDMDRSMYAAIMRKNTIWKRFIYRGVRICGLVPNLFTIETERYVKSLQNIPIFKNKIHLLPNGSWMGMEFSDLGNDIDLMGKKQKIILTVGRLGTKQKNTELLLDAFAHIPRNLRDNWLLVLVGDYTEEIKEKAQLMAGNDFSLSGRILFTGNITNKKILGKYYEKALIFCLPSRWESFGIALIEAMQYGDFPIVTNCCDAFEDILDNPEIGTVVPNENSFLLTQALKNAMNNPKETQKRGLKAKLKAEKDYCWKNIVKKLNMYLNER